MIPNNVILIPLKNNPLSINTRLITKIATKNIKALTIGKAINTT